MKKLFLITAAILISIFGGISTFYKSPTIQQMSNEKISQRVQFQEYQDGDRPGKIVEKSKNQLQIENSPEGKLLVQGVEYGDILKPISPDGDITDKLVYYSLENEPNSIFKLNLDSQTSEKIINLLDPNDPDLNSRINALKFGEKSGLAVLENGQVLIIDSKAKKAFKYAKYNVEGSSLVSEIIDVGPNIGVLKIFDKNYLQNDQTEIITINLKSN